MKVPFLDLKSQYLSIKDKIAVAIQQVLVNTAFASGPFVAKFEKQFAEFCQTQHAAGVSSGTSALWLSLLALGVGPGESHHRAGCLYCHRRGETLFHNQNTCTHVDLRS